MGTDNLTEMAYEGIRLAMNAADVLRIEFGAACGQYRTEDEYLQGIRKDVKRIQRNPREYLDGWNLLEETDTREFKEKIKILREPIEKAIVTPIGERGEPNW